MKRFAIAAGVLAVSVTIMPGISGATPSTTYWTPATTDVQPYKVFHIGIDNYFTVGKKGDSGSLPTDVGLTVGVLPYEKVQLEVGVDYLGGSKDPFYLNAKIGSPEGALFDGSPALNLGVFNAGTDRKDDDGDGRTDYNILHVMAGKTLPLDLGRVHLGFYYGNRKALIDINGEKENAGFMIGWDKGYSKVRDKDGVEYSRWVLAADYATGKNAIGGGGFGVYHYFTKDIALLTGPVWFNEPALAGPNANTKWVWTTQLDINY